MRYVVDDGKPNKLDPAGVETRVRFDPPGLPNPGKLCIGDTYSRGHVMARTAPT